MLPVRQTESDSVWGEDDPPRPDPGASPLIPALIAFAVAYWLSVRVGLMSVAQPEGIALLWPPNGVALAALLLSPTARWPAFLGVLFAVNVAGNLAGGNLLPVSLGFGVANVADAVTVGAVMRRFCSHPLRLSRTSEAITLCLALPACGMVTAWVGAGVSAVGKGAPLVSTWFTWFASNGLGTLLIAPLIVTCATRPVARRDVSLGRMAELALLLLVSAAVVLVSGTATADRALAFAVRPYELFPVMVWAALRFGPRATLSLVGFQAALVVYRTVGGGAPYLFHAEEMSRAEIVMETQILLSALSATALVLSTLVSERTRIRLKVLRLNEELERRVAERTAELAAANRELAENARMERERERLAQMDKQAALGRVLAGLAHEMNNPANFITLNAGVLRDAWRDAAAAARAAAAGGHHVEIAGMAVEEAEFAVRNMIAGVADGAERITKLVASLREFARPDAYEKKRTDIAEVVRTCVAILDGELRAAPGGFAVEYESGVPPVMADADRIEQVVAGLLRNACDAVAGTQGHIRVRTALDPDTGEVMVVVSDGGVGMDEAALRAVADPFYTTKRDAGRVGLSLSICSRIVADHGGRLEFQSKPGEGTVVWVRLPVGSAE